MKFKTRIFLAVVIGLVMIGGSLWWVNSRQDVVVTPKVTLNLEGPSRNFIQVTDKNNDLIPDWQEALAVGETIYLDNLNTISTSSDSFQLPSQTATAVALLLKEHIESQVTGDPSASRTEIVDKVYEYMRLQINEDVPMTAGNFTIIDSTSDPIIRQYGNDVAAAMYEYPAPVNIRDELTIFNEALETNNPDKLQELDVIIASYENMLRRMYEIPVPREFIEEHLALTNVYQSLLIDIKAFRDVFKDELPAMLRLQRYSKDASGLYTAIVNIYQKIYERGIKWVEGDIAGKLITVEE